MSLLHSRAALAAVIMIAAGSSGALAKGGHGGQHRGFGIKFHSMHSHHHRHHHPKLYFYTGGCGYYFDRWQYTGSFYWKKQYYVCKGWW